jgi:hypothetical protein
MFVNHSSVTGEYEHVIPKNTGPSDEPGISKLQFYGKMTQMIISILRRSSP